MLALARFIDEHCEDPLRLALLAERVGLSSTHLQKRFKAQIGVSPKEYQQACRLKKFKARLRRTKSITASVYETGHGSSSRVYERLDERVGMTPRQYQREGAGLAISYAVGKTPLGKILIAATDRGICFVQFADSDRALLGLLEEEFPQASLTKMRKSQRSQFKLWLHALNAYLEGSLAQLDLPLDVQGTAFQLSVWKYLQKIPRGEVMSYAELAHQLGRPTATRAVASACARNTIAILIPCHRVLRGSGALGGYRWGLARKERLLEIEEGPAGPS